MSRPEDIPESVWLEAGMLFDRLYDAEPNLEGGCYQGVTDTIARAIMAERARTTDLVDCLSDMTEHYVQLVSCGDCGNWDAEEESEVIAARKMIAAYRGQS